MINQQLKPAPTDIKGSLNGAAVFVFLICAAAGALLGYAMPGVQSSGDDYKEKLTTYLVTTSKDGTFNWLFFSIFLATGIIAATICYAAGWVAASIPTVIPEPATTD